MDFLNITFIFPRTADQQRARSTSEMLTYRRQDNSGVRSQEKLHFSWLQLGREFSSSWVSARTLDFPINWIQFLFRLVHSRTLYLSTKCVRTVLYFPDLPDEGPIIAGGQPRYHIGDRVNVNCTSLRSNPAAKLKWYINGEEADPALLKHYEVVKNSKGLETPTLGLRYGLRGSGHCN